MRDLRVPKSQGMIPFPYRRLSEDFSGTNLRYSLLSNTIFENCKFDRAQLLGTDCRNAQFTGRTSMRSAAIFAALLDEAQFRGVDFSDARLNGDITADISGALFAGAEFSGADLRQVRFDAHYPPRFYAPDAGAGSKKTNLGGCKLRTSLLRMDWSFLNINRAVWEDFPTDFTGLRAPYADLGDYNFAGKNLTNADFTGADISRADFTGAILKGAIFAGQDLRPVKLDRADLTGADLTGANLSGKTVDRAILTRAKMIATNCQGAKLASCIVTAPATFSTDPKRRTSFEAAEFPPSLLGLNWEALDLRNLPESVHFPQDLSELNARHALLHGLNLSGKILVDAKFDHAELRGASLADCDLSSASFQNAFLQGGEGAHPCDLSKAYMKNAVFDDANLTGVTATYCYFFEQSASMARATLADCDFSFAYMTGAKFQGIAGNAVRGVKFTGACLVNANFNGVAFSNYGDTACTLTNALLQGATFNNATLTGVFMRDAAIPPRRPMPAPSAPRAATVPAPGTSCRRPTRRSSGTILWALDKAMPSGAL